MTALIGSTLFLLLKEITKNWKIAFIFTLISLYLCRFMFVARAQIISFWLFILEFWCIEKLLETNKKRYVISLIIIPIIIANIHSSVFLTYFVFYLPFIVENILYKIFSKFESNIPSKKENKLKYFLYKTQDKIKNKFKIEKKEHIKTLLIVGFIALFTGLCTTAGFAPYTDMLKAMTGVSTDFIGELKHSTIYNNKMFYYIIFAVTALVGFTKIRPKITDIFFLMGFGVMTISTFRCLYFFVLIGATPIARIILEFIDVYSIEIKSKLLKIGLIICAILIFVISYGSIFFLNQTNEYVPKSNYPVDACDWILKNVDIEKMRIFNNFNYGSYIEFRGIKAFIDSRSGMFCDEFNKGTTILVDWLESKDNPENAISIFNKYGITHVLLEKTAKQLEVVKENKSWKIIYEDNNFFLFERVGE